MNRILLMGFDQEVRSYICYYGNLRTLNHLIALKYSIHLPNTAEIFKFLLSIQNLRARTIFFSLWGGPLHWFFFFFFTSCHAACHIFVGKIRLLIRTLWSNDCGNAVPVKMLQHFWLTWMNPLLELHLWTLQLATHMLRNSSCIVQTWHMLLSWDCISYSTRNQWCQKAI